MTVENKDTLLEEALEVFDLKEDRDCNDQEERLRNSFHTHFISSRSMALNALKEGLSLNGKL